MGKIRAMSSSEGACGHGADYLTAILVPSPSHIYQHFLSPSFLLISPFFKGRGRLQAGMGWTKINQSIQFFSLPLSSEGAGGHGVHHITPILLPNPIHTYQQL